MTQYTAGLPMPQAPLVDLTSGAVTPVWYNWMIKIFSRTGGSPGLGITDVQTLAAKALATALAAQGTALPSNDAPLPDGIAAPGTSKHLSRGDHIHPSGGGALVPVILGVSPFVYTAPAHGAVLVRGPGVIRLELSFDGATFYQTGSWYGAFPLASGATVRLTFIGSPTLTFIPT